MYKFSYIKPGKNGDYILFAYDHLDILHMIGRFSTYAKAIRRADEMGIEIIDGCQ